MATPAVDAVTKGTNRACHARRCSNSGCTLTLSGAPRTRVLVNLEHDQAPVSRQEPHCDYLFVSDGGDGNPEWVAPIELTTGRADSRKFLRQLTAGAAIADRLLPRNITLRFRPIAAYDGQMRRAERDNLLNPANKITFRNRSELVRVVHCGSPLMKALTG